MNSERKNYPMKEFRAIFPISSILVIRSGYAKKGHFPVLAVFQNIWDLHKFGLQIWIQNCKNYPMKEFRAIFSISSILVIRSGYAKKGHFPVLAVFQNIWDLHKFGLQIWIQNAKITLWKNFGQFFRFHRFWSSGPGMQKKISFSILAVFQNVWDLHKFWVANLNSECKNYPMKEFRAIFPISSILVIRSGYAKKDQFLNICCISKYMGFT